MPKPDPAASREAVAVLRDHLGALLTELRTNAHYSDDPVAYRQEMAEADSIQERVENALFTVERLLDINTKDRA